MPRTDHVLIQDRNPEVDLDRSQKADRDPDQTQVDQSLGRGLEVDLVHFQGPGLRANPLKGRENLNLDQDRIALVVEAEQNLNHVQGKEP